jgi:hypothetical protein
MHGVLTAWVAAVEDGPTVRPSPLASIVLLFLLAATVLLLWSFMRHLRRAQANLGPAEPTQVLPSGSDEVEGDTR